MLTIVAGYENIAGGSILLAQRADRYGINILSRLLSYFLAWAKSIDCNKYLPIDTNI
jgi:hypothetical protein